MDVSYKLQVFAHRHGLNERAQTQTLHLSLNFDEQDALSGEQLVRIAKSYLEQIGFGSQPYLVYQHRDSGHPHLHVVTSTIREDGSRIPTHHIGKKVSEKARKELETAFGLVPAQGRQRRAQPALHKATYGQAPTQSSIEQVVGAVIQKYRYTSLEQFNAVLRSYGVVADRGNPSGRIYQNRGLVYRLLDEHGRATGVPIKASALAGKPTLTFLEQQFQVNQLLRHPYQPQVQHTIDQALAQSTSLSTFQQVLHTQGIEARVHPNQEGQPSFITFVDHNSRCVFSDLELNPAYRINALQSRLSAATRFIQAQQRENVTQHPAPAIHPDETPIAQQPAPSFLSTQASDYLADKISHDLQKTNAPTQLVDTLLSPTPPGESPAYELLQKKRRKNRKPHLKL